MIAGFFDGRIRLRADALKRAETMGMALAFIQERPGILRVTPNGRVGSILIEYDPGRLSREAVESALAPFAAMCAPQRNGALPAPHKDSGLLLCALGFTCVALLFDKRAHALCGAALSALSLAHYAARRQRRQA